MVLWIAVGGLAGMLFVVSQWLTLAHLPLHNPRKARWQIAGGACVRVVLTAGLFVGALRQEMTFMVLAVLAWWLARWLTLYSLSNLGPLTPVYLDHAER